MSDGSPTQPYHDLERQPLSEHPLVVVILTPFLILGLATAYTALRFVRWLKRD